MDLKSIGTKLGISAVGGIVVGAIVKWVVASLLSTTVVAVAAGIVAAYALYTRVALWEYQKLVDQAKAVVK